MDLFSGAVFRRRRTTCFLIPNAKSYERMMSFNPHRIRAGRALDYLVQEHLMSRGIESCPEYSRDPVAAFRAANELKAAYGVSIVTGRTTLNDRPWFARVAEKRGVEVLAETLPLAICRLTLLKLQELTPYGSR
jgi:hypothetical protein